MHLVHLPIEKYEGIHDEPFQQDVNRYHRRLDLKEFHFQIKGRWISHRSMAIECKKDIDNTQKVG